MKKIRKLISHEDLLRVLDYDEVTGDFYWLERSEGWTKPGQLAGKINANGYRHIKIFQKWYYAHRLAWFYKTKRWPVAWIDHRNGRKADNRWLNLRESTNSQNGWNSKKRKNNRSGYKWVVNNKGSFYAAIRDGKKQRRFGPFKSAEQAYSVAVEFAKTQHKEFFRGH